MSRKHFVVAAEKIANIRQVAVTQPAGYTRELLEVRAQAAEDIFSTVAREFNPNFDAARFAAACRAGVSAEKGAE